MKEYLLDYRNVLSQRGSLVSETPDFKVKPEDIDCSKHLFDAYGNNETEISAGWIIRMLQKKGSWAPFTKEDIETFYQAGGFKDGFTFNQLVNPGTSFFAREGNVQVGGGWIVEKDGKFHVTTTFVEAALKSSLANKSREISAATR